MVGSGVGKIGSKIKCTTIWLWLEKNIIKEVPNGKVYCEFSISGSGILLREVKNVQLDAFCHPIEMLIDVTSQDVALGEILKPLSREGRANDVV